MTEGYVVLPSFVVDEELSAWEGETMHKVGDLEPRGDYHVNYANILMKELVLEYCRRIGPEQAQHFLRSLS